MTEKLSIKQNLEAIRNNIEKAKSQSPYKQNVRLLAATKTVSAEIINYATKELGITDIGENRVQELLSKYADLDLSTVNLHFIGRLQRNKVKYIIDKVTMIHSVDSVRLAEEINKQAERIGKVMDILIEINSGNEENKGGINPEELEVFVDSIKNCKSLRIKGLMTIAPVCDNKDDYSVFFNKTYHLCVDILAKKLHNINVLNGNEDIDCLEISMGMSDSYEQAILNGSTIVRIGTSIFGKRN